MSIKKKIDELKKAIIRETDIEEEPDIRITFHLRDNHNLAELNQKFYSPIKAIDGKEPEIKVYDNYLGKYISLHNSDLCADDNMTVFFPFPKGVKHESR
ncbi:MAG: hypothetical protein ACOCTM_04265 [Bacteroidota bacterium]